MFCGLAHKIAILSKKTASGGGGGGGDVTPNAVNWTNGIGFDSSQTNNVTITGIDTAINLRFDYSGNIGGSDGAFYYSKNNGGSWTLIDNSITTSTESSALVSMSNSQTLIFKFDQTTITTVVLSVSVVNTSDSNAVLDTFTLQTDCSFC
jgi:hypothetical protein